MADREPEPVAFLTVNNLSQVFDGVTIFKGLTFEVAAGEVVALVGENGVGKTTTLRCITGLDQPAEGIVEFHGQPLDERRPDVRRKLCALLDDGVWFPDLTILEHLYFFATAFGQELSICHSALEEVGIPHLADRLPHTLSSGQTQRARLAQAMVRPWDLLILDEPEQRLDDAGREWLGPWLRRQVNEGRAILMASHDASVRSISGAREVRVVG